MRLHRSVPFLSFLLCFCFSIQAAAAASTPAADTTITRKSYKLSQQQFIDRYGTDATSRALIRFYYKKHQKNKVLTLMYSVWLVIEGALIGLALLATSANLLIFLVLISLGAAAYVTAAVVLVSAIFLLLNSRKRLYRLVQQYRATGALPRRVSRKKVFLRLLDEEQKRL